MLGYVTIGQEVGEWYGRSIVELFEKLALREVVSSVRFGVSDCKRKVEV